MGCGCGCSKDNSNNKKEFKYITCPDCGLIAKNVPHDVLETMVKKELKDQITDNKYYICKGSGCNTVYIDEANQSKFTLEELNKPIWFKKDSYPKIACYCNNITYDQVEKAVEEEGLTNWKDIILNYKEKAVCMCEKLNPTGECCSDNFYKVVNEVLKQLGKKPVSSSGSCCG
ncbi:MAG: hypothetical protein ACQEQH_05600 [Bacillota bacterium]